MQVIDKVYGQINITEPVVLEIIKTSSFQRLKGIDQAGYPALYYNPHSLLSDRLKHSRYDHSLGVYFLLNKVNASLEEQIAGLLHDLSHSVFSHCIDYILDEGSQTEHSYQDDIFEKFVRSTQVPTILSKYNLDVDYILNEDNFSLLETKIPDLCADRIDYSLRTAVHFKIIDTKNISYILSNLFAIDNKWIFKEYKIAKKFAELFFKLNKDYYSGIMSAVMFQAVGDTMRHALQNKYISKKDLYTTDDEVLFKIKKYVEDDQRLQKLWLRMNNKVKFVNDEQKCEAHIFCKSRIVDPLFQDDREIKRVSDVDDKWSEIVKQELKPKKYFIKFID